MNAPALHALIDAPALHALIDAPVRSRPSRARDPARPVHDPRAGGLRPAHDFFWRRHVRLSVVRLSHMLAPSTPTYEAESRP
eukprot:3014897-Prymnesium_polylepis.1